MNCTLLRNIKTLESHTSLIKRLKKIKQVMVTNVQRGQHAWKVHPTLIKDQIMTTLNNFLEESMSSKTQKPPAAKLDSRANIDQPASNLAIAL